MTYEIKTENGYNGWTAESSAILGETPDGVRKLTLRTSKIRNGLAASARVSIHKNSESGFSIMTTELFGDFAKSGIASTPCKRVTEKAVLDVHTFALQHMPELIAEAKAFYDRRDEQSAT